MSKVSISLNGRTYAVACDDGQESRVLELAARVDKIMRDIARSGAARSETYLLVLTSLVLADQVDNAVLSPEESEKAKRQKKVEQDALEHLTTRIQKLAETITKTA